MFKFTRFDSVWNGCLYLKYLTIHSIRLYVISNATIQPLIKLQNKAIKLIRPTNTAS